MKKREGRKIKIETMECFEIKRFARELVGWQGRVEGISKRTRLFY